MEERLTETSIHITMPRELRDEIVALAREADRPVNREIRAALRERIERHRAVAADHERAA